MSVTASGGVAGSTGHGGDAGTPPWPGASQSQAERRTAAGVHGARGRRLPSWAISWLQVSPLALILLVLFALPTVLFLIVSFYDYDRTGLYPAFILDNYR